MISVMKLRANGDNARASTGPRTAAGKVRARRNAYKHGLSVPVMADSSLAAEVKILARKIAGEGANDQVKRLAVSIAEAHIDVLRVRRARNELLSRAPLCPVPNIFPDDWDLEVGRSWGSDNPKRMSRAHKRSIEKSIERDEFGPTLADCAASLTAMDRYERRALSRRKFAIRALDALRQQFAA
jgi:hypothetical protein